MKIKQEVDLTAVLTMLGFIFAIVIWGIRLESRVSENVARFTVYEQMQEKQQQLQFDSIEKRIDCLAEDLTLLENRAREPDHEGR